MKTMKLLPALISALMFSATAWGGGDPVLRASVAEETQISQSPNLVIRQIIYKGSDVPSVDDPLGNNPVSPRDDAGPPATRHLSYDANCVEVACARAERRWSSPTNWRHDRATGLSTGWGR